MSKLILTKKQAIAVLEQAKKSEEMNLFSDVDVNHPYFKLSCEELEKKLLKYIDPDSLAGVVDEPIIKE